MRCEVTARQKKSELELLDIYIFNPLFIKHFMCLTIYNKAQDPPTII